MPSAWRRYLAKRVLQLVVTLFAVSIVVFLAARLSGDPAGLMLGPQASPSQVIALRHALGLDRPLFVQYASYLGGVLHGDLGTSLWQDQPVTTLILQRFPATLELALGAMCLVVVATLTLGTASALRRGSALDTLIVGFLSMLQAMPVFWAGPLLILVFALGLKVLPAFGRDDLAGLVLPALTLSMVYIAQSARILRSELIDKLNAPFVEAATARGLSRPRVVVRHAGRVAAIPVVTIFGLQWGGLLGGAIITETIFAWPGIGQLTIQALDQRDYPLVQGCVFFLAVVFIVVNFAVDVSYLLLDPRVRLDQT